MSEHDENPEGKWVHVVSGSSNPYTGAPTSEFGVLEARDAAFLYVRRADGRRAVLPIALVRSLRVIEPPPPVPGGSLLRAASSDDLLVRPGLSASRDPDLLARPALAVAAARSRFGFLSAWLRLLRLILHGWR